MGMSEDVDLKEILEAQRRILDVLAKLEEEDPDRPPTFGEKVADWTVQLVGSWRFLIGQGAILTLYIIANILMFSFMAFDPYPFILLNLLLSFQAAFTAPLILISQNRTEHKDRRRAIDAYKTVLNIEEMMSQLKYKIERKKNGLESKDGNSVS